MILFGGKLLDVNVSHLLTSGYLAIAEQHSLNAQKEKNAILTQLCIKQGSMLLIQQPKLN